MKRLACIFLPLFVLSGCVVAATPAGDDGESSRGDLSDEGDSEATPKKKTKSTDTKAPASSTSDADPGDTSDAPVDPPAAPAGPDVTYGVTIPETKAVAFGGITADGKQVCALQSWKNVTITVVANDKGLTKSFTFTGTNVEQANPACPGVTAQPENEHRYTFTNDAPADAPAKLVPAPANKPQAQLVADVAVHADAGGRVTLNFHRSDAAAPLDWQYTMQFQLTKQ